MRPRAPSCRTTAFSPPPPPKIPQPSSNRPSHARLSRPQRGSELRDLVTTAKGRGAGGAGNARRTCSSKAAQAREPSRLTALDVLGGWGKALAARGARPRTAPAKAVRRSQPAPADLTGHSHTRFCRAARAGTSPDSQPARPSPPNASMNNLSPNRGARVKNPTAGVLDHSASKSSPRPRISGNQRTRRRGPATTYSGATVA